MALRRMYGSATARIFNGGLYACLALAGLLQRVHQGQGVHHSAQHAHIVGGRLVHAHFQAFFAAPQVARADHDTDLHTHFADLFDALGDVLSRAFRADAVPLRSGQGFTAQFQHD